MNNLDEARRSGSYDGPRTIRAWDGSVENLSKTNRDSAAAIGAPSEACHGRQPGDRSREAKHDQIDHTE